MSVHDLKKQAARASVVLTNGEVAATALDISKAGNMAVHDAQVRVRADFTVGNLTNVIIRGYSSQDGTTYDLMYGEGGLAAIYTLTATDTVTITLPRADGSNYVRVTAQGTGDFTGSLLALDYHWLRKGTQI